MKKFAACVILVATSLGLLGAYNYQKPVNITVSEALQELGFKLEDGAPGSDPKFKISDENLKKLNKNKGKTITVTLEGEVKIK